MAKIQRVGGTTSQIVEIEILDSTSTVGAGKTGLAYNTSGLTCYYKRNTGSASVAVTLDNVTTLGTYEPSNAAHGAFKEVDSTNMKGVYEFQLPNNALASGADTVTFIFTGATGMVDCRLEVELTATNNQDAVRGGMTAFPNVATGNAGAVLVDGTGTAAIANASGKVLLQATQTGVTIPTVTTVTNQLSSSTIATAVLTTVMAENYAGLHATGTLAQMLYMIYSAVMQISISGTTMSLTQLDGATPWGTVTLSSSTQPISRVRAS